MKSKIVLYAKCGIEKNKLFILDDFSTYLSTLSTKVINDFQYVRQGLNVSIKVDMNQNSLNPDTAVNYNYCSIQNGSEKIFYYFIDSKKQVAENTIQFNLILDSINTFSLGSDFYITDKTMINRMHKDRFAILPASTMTKTYVCSGQGKTVAINPSITRYTHAELNTEFVGYTIDSYNVIINNNYVGLVSATLTGDFLSLVFQAGSLPQEFSYQVTLTLIGTERVVRKIDRPSEGLSPILYGENLGELIEDNSNVVNHAYLVYTGSSTIKALVTFDHPTQVKIAGNEILDKTDFNVGTYYYFVPDENNFSIGFNYFLEDDDGNHYLVGYTRTATDYYYRYILVITTDGTNLFVGYIILAYYSSGSYAFTVDYREPTIQTSKVIVTFSPNRTSIRAFTLASWTIDTDVMYAATSQNYSITTTTYNVKTISSLNRTDTNLVKIIKLPYSPVDVDNASASWGYDSVTGFLEYKNLDERLISKITANITRNPLTDLIFDDSNISATDVKSADNESKLFHSDYYQPKFVYDAFSKVFALERINLSSYTLFTGMHFVFNFVATNTIASKFIFSFPQYVTDGYMQEDYDDILAVDRNNEMVIYTSDYMQYIKTGFNYDIKKKNRQEVGQWAGTALSLIGAIASFASAGVTHGFGVAAGISLATTAMAQLVNAVNTTAQAEATQQQKLMQLRHQKESVYNTDAVDLLDYYANNKAKLMLYKVSDQLKKSLWDLFFYTGYVCGYRGTPDFTSRLRFNFVSCELDFDYGHTYSKYITEEILQDIASKYSAGVTRIHHYDSTWDIEQHYENWETFLFE